MTTTTAAPAYAPGEALTASMSARAWMDRFAPGVFAVMSDMGAADQGLAEITARADSIAHDLGLPRSETGAYPGVIWELEAALNR